MKKPIFYLIFLFITIPCFAQAQKAGLNPAKATPDSFDPNCLDETDPEYPDWVEWGRPECWCYSRQCRGDADGMKTGPFWVAVPDLWALQAAFNKMDIVLATIPNGICADFDHTKTGPFRVAVPDLNIFRQYFNKLESYVPDCYPCWIYPWCD